MSIININWLSDTSDCETCGGNWAEGAEVFINGERVIDMTPRAHCYDGVHYTEQEVYRRILEHLGHTLNEQE